MWALTVCLSPVMTHTVAAAEEARTVYEHVSGNPLKGGPNDVHALILDQTAVVFRCGVLDGAEIVTDPAGITLAQAAASAESKGERRGVYTSRVIAAAFPFNELVPSWNVDVAPGTGFRVDVRFGRERNDFWTAFFYLGTWGIVPEFDEKVLKSEHGIVDVDCFRSRETFDRLQYRVILATSEPARLPVVRRVALAYSNTLDDAELARRYRQPVDPGLKERWARRLPVPFRSQLAEDEKIRGSICSPTSTGMVMAYRGVDRPTAEMAALIYDAEYEMYGTWLRAVEGAYLCGVPGYIERFGDWNAVKRHISNGQPVIASIRAEAGELRGAPYRRSNGHLIVIVGFDADGNVHVNDPAARSPEQGITTYAREDMETVWLAHGGVGYILQDPKNTAAPTSLPGAAGRDAK